MKRIARGLLTTLLLVSCSIIFTASVPQEEAVYDDYSIYGENDTTPDYNSEENKKLEEIKLEELERFKKGYEKGEVKSEINLDESRDIDVQLQEIEELLRVAE